MKKKHLTNAKKTLSVFLSVLMLMTCWVFIPAEHNHASAVEQTTFGDICTSLLSGITDQSFSTTLTTVTGSFEDDSQHATSLYQNLLYSPVVGTNRDTNYCSYCWWNVTLYKSGNYINIFYPTTVMVSGYNGTPQMPVSMSCHPGNANYITPISCYINNSGTGLNLNGTWHGDATSGNRDYSHFYQAYYVLNSNNGKITTDGSVGSPYKYGNSNYHFSNTMSFTGSVSADTYYSAIIPDFYWRGGNNGTEGDTTLKSTTSGFKGNPRTVYVIKYDTLKTALDQAKTAFENIKNYPNRYSVSSVKRYVELANALLAARPYNYISSSTAEADIPGKVAAYGAAAKEAVNNWNNFALEERKYDATAESIFSFADWYYSTSNACGHYVTYTPDVNAGTITIKSHASYSEATTSHSGDSTRTATNYAMPINGGQQYTIAYDTSSAVSTQVFAFFYDDEGKAFTDWANYHGDFNTAGTHTYTLTAPVDADYMEIRFDVNNTHVGNGVYQNYETTFSNIRVIDTARYNEIDLANWVSGKNIRNVYSYSAYPGAAVGTIETPTRYGYDFAGWYADTNYDGEPDAAISSSTNINNQSWPIYSTWTEHPYDIGYDNLFSVSGMYFSGSRNLGGGATGTVDFDLDAGTITTTSVTKVSNNEVYTSYGSDGFTMTVEPETDYIFTTDIDFADDSTSMHGQMFIFCYDDSGNGLVGPTNLEDNVVQTVQHIGKYPSSEGTHSIKFKTPKNCTKLRVRVGSTDIGVIATYYNIGVFKLDDYNAYVNSYNKIREPYRYGDTTQLMTPTKEGYTFDGWYTAGGEKIETVEGLHDNYTVYAQWTKLYTVTFLDGNGATLKSVTVKEGQDIAAADMPEAASVLKASDDNYAYAWDGTWTGGSYSAATSITNVTADVTLTPSFTGTKHTIILNGLYSNATCTAPATYFMYCSVCGYDFGGQAQPSGNPLGHTFDLSEGASVVKGSTTGDDGTHSIKCARCDVTDGGYAHSFITISTSGATCTTPGTLHQNCACGQTRNIAGATDPNVHIYDETKGTSNGDGATHTVVCKENASHTKSVNCTDSDNNCICDICSQQLTHNYVYQTTTNVAEEATCETNTIYYKTCKCGAYGTETWEKANTALGHNWTNTTKYLVSAAACEKDAVYYKECSRCNISSEDKTGATWTDTGSALEHDFTGAVKCGQDGTHSYLCTKGCGTYGGETACTYSGWVKADVTSHEKTCTVCGYVVTQAHNWGEWECDSTSHGATSTKTRECQDCDAIETIMCEYTEAYTEKTCTTPGYTTYTCTLCGNGYTVYDAENPATGHNFTGEYRYFADSDKHQRLCANGCGVYGIGTTEGETEDCTLNYTSNGNDTHSATCVCGNSHTYDCSGGQESCTAKPVCEICDAAYGEKSDHNFNKNGGVVTFDNEDYHAYLCEYCKTEGLYGVGSTEEETEPCSGGTATCSAKAICEVCGDTHGEEDADNHKWSATAAPDAAKPGEHTYTCEYNNTHTKNEVCVSVSSVVTDPTCTKDGFTTQTCACGYSWKTDETDALEHDFGIWTYDAENGGHYRTCTRNCGEAGATETGDCNDTKQQTGLVSPSCTEQGYTNYICLYCDHEWSADYTDPLGHTYETEEDDAKILNDEYKYSTLSCTTDEAYWYACSRCHKSAENADDANTNPQTWVHKKAPGHDYSDKITEDAYKKSDATCTAAAVYYYACANCDESSEGDTDVTYTYGSKAEHTWAEIVDTNDLSKNRVSEADCTSKAVYYKSCSACGAVSDETFEYGEVAGHSLTHYDAIAGSCTENGQIEYWECSVCGNKYKDEACTTIVFASDIVIKAEGHKLVKTEAKAATCEEDGNTAYWTCSVCSKLFSDKNGNNETTAEAVKIAKTGHDFSGDWYCDTVHNYHSKYCVNENCTVTGLDGVKYSATLDGVDYVYEGGVACAFTGAYRHEVTADGVHQHILTCECGNEQVVACAATTTTEDVASTCTEKGYTINTCSVCNTSWNTNYIDALGHDFADEATSNGNGTHSVKCTRCDAFSSSAACSGGTATCSAKAICEVCGAEYGDFTAHAWGEYTYNNDATCTANGTKTATCTVCSTATNTITAEDTKLGHDMSEYTYDISGWLNKPSDFDEEIAEPNCKTEGKQISYCSRCSTYRIRIVAKDTSTHVWDCESDDYTQWTYIGGDCASGITYQRECTLCGKTESYVDTNVEHEYKLEASESATCTEESAELYVCSVCGFAKEEHANPAKGHKWGDKIIDKEATCKNPGRAYYLCTVCGAKSEFEEIAKLTHAWDKNDDGITDADFVPGEDDVIYNQYKFVEATQASCTVDGYAAYFKCNNCSYDQHLDPRWLAIEGNHTAASGHADTNGDGKCDGANCGKDLSNSGGCGCICHKDNWFMQIIYKILRFFWKIFGIAKTCDCGHVHY